MDDTEAVRDNSQCQGWRRQGKAGTIGWVLGPRHRGLSNDWYLYGT